MNASEIIDELGGTAAVAKLCDVRQPSVSEWRRFGIPKAREQYLRLLRPDLFTDQHADQQKAICPEVFGPADSQPTTSEARAA